MKILFPKMIFYPSNVGGRSQAVYWLTKALNKSGKVEPIIITTNKHLRKDEVIVDKFISNDVGTAYYSSDGTSFPFKMLLKSLKTVNEVDLIHLSSLFFKPNLFIALYGKFHNKKIIWSIRGELEAGALGFKGLYKRIYIHLIKMLFEKSVLFHTTSDSETKNLYKYFPKAQVVQLPNYMKLPQKIELPVKKQFLFMGRINPIKALDNLLLGLQSSKHFIHSDYELIIAGTEDYDGYKTKLINIMENAGLQDKVKFIGSVNGEEKEKLFAESYFLFLPSHSENFGNVIIESLAQSTPVIASKGTPWEVLENYSSGFWVDNSPKSLGRVIDKIIELEPDDYMIMREQSYELVNNEFNIDTKIDAWIEVYESLLGENK